MTNEKDNEMSAGAKLAWKCILYPIGAALAAIGIAVLVAALAVVLGTVLTPAVLLLWNWGAVAAAPLVGVTLPSISLSQAWAVGLSIMLLRMAFTNNTTNRNTSAVKPGK